MKYLFSKSSNLTVKILTFGDGNKRVVFVLMDIFLQKNGWELVSSEAEAYVLLMDLACGSLTKSRLSRWLKEHSAKSSHR